MHFTDLNPGFIVSETHMPNPQTMDRPLYRGCSLLGALARWGHITSGYCAIFDYRLSRCCKRTVKDMGIIELFTPGMHGSCGRIMESKGRVFRGPGTAKTQGKIEKAIRLNKRTIAKRVKEQGLTIKSRSPIANNVVFLS